MDIAKNQQLAGNTAGVFFGVGISLITAWTCAQEPRSFNLLPYPIAWAGIGLFEALITVGFIHKFQRTNRVASVGTQIPGSISETFQLMNVIKTVSQTAAQVIFGFLIALAGAALNYQSFKNGSWAATSYLLHFAGGWILALLFWPYLKNRFGTLGPISSTRMPGVRPPAPSKWKGTFLIDETEQGFKLTLPVTIIGDPGSHDFSFSVGLGEIRTFRIMQTEEESRLTRTRKIDGNIALLGQSLIETAKFNLNPKYRPTCYIDDGAWSPGNIYVSIEGGNLFYFISVQSQFLPVLLSIQNKVREVNSVRA